MVFALYNGLFLLPVILSLFGPPRQRRRRRSNSNSGGGGIPPTLLQQKGTSSGNAKDGVEREEEEGNLNDISEVELRPLRHHQEEEEGCGGETKEGGNVDM